MKKLLLLIALFQYLILPAETLRFSKFTSDEGLSQSEVYSFLQDQQGFMWIGTVDGLNRYDGYKIKRYNINKSDSNRLSNNTVRTLVQDKIGRIWIGTDDGLNVIYPSNQKSRFFRLPYKKNNALKITDLFVDNHILWISTNCGLFQAKIDNEEMEAVEKSCSKVKQIGNINIDLKSINLVRRVSGGDYLIGYSSGLIHCYADNKTGRLKLVENGINHPKLALGVSIIQEDLKHNIWLGNVNSIDFRLLRVEPKNYSITMYEEENNSTSLSSNKISSIALDPKGNLWIGTVDRGLNLIPSKSVSDKMIQFQHIKNNIFNPNSLNSNLIYSLYVSNDNNLWIGTIGSGTNILNLDQKPITHYLIPPRQDEKTLHSNFIRSIFLDKKNRLWIGAHNNGLFIYDKQKESYQKIGFDTQIVFQLSWFDDNTILACTSSGVFFISQDGAVTKIKNIERACIYAVKSSERILWVGGVSGLYRIELNGKNVVSCIKYDETTKSIKFSNENCRVLHYEKRKNELWVGTEGAGLNILSLDANHFPINNRVYKSNSQENSLSNNYIRSIIQTDANTFWIGTHDGLNKVSLDKTDRKILHFKPIFMRDGLSNNMIQSLVEDLKGNIWIGTNNGLCKLEPKSLKIVSYNKTDGLQSNEFSERTALLSQSGELYIGGINGVSSFYPNRINISNRGAKVTVTDFFLFNERVNTQEEVNGRIILERPIFSTDKIRLKPNETSFRFDFSSMNFSSPEKIRYAYMLEGFDKKWNITDANNRTATYTNLSHGSYTFLVKATNSDGVWGDSITKIDIKIATPFYLTWFAFLIYIAIISMGFYYFTRYSVIKIATKQQIILDADHNQRLHELDVLRTRFFINISHDLRTPLTLIAGPLEQIINNKNYPKPLLDQLGVVYRNATKLKYLVEQLLDFRKAEVGKLKPSLRKVEVNAFIKEEVDHFDFILKEKGIDLIYDFKKEKIIKFIDTEKTAKVLFNLVSNALKYTKKGFVEVTVDCIKGKNGEDALSVSIRDSGMGIEENKLGEIFDRFYNNNSSITESSYGIGLSHCKDLIEVMNGEISASSQVGNGSTFTFLLPMPKSIDNDSETILIPESKKESISEAQMDSKIGLVEEVVLQRKESTILIVEDNPEMRSYIKSCLIESYNILEAENGADGFELAMEHSPNLIVSDYVMPIMDGIEFCKKIKSTLETSHIPVILLTAHTDNDIKYKGLELGADDYINKPFDSNYLLIKIKNLISNRDNLRKLFQNNIIFEPSKVAVTSTDEIFLNTLMQEIEKGIPNPDFTVESLEKEMNMSHAKFYNKLKSLTGMSGKELLQDFRLKRAAQILVDNDVTIADICYMVGFSDPKYFSSCFKAKFKVTPTQYKASQTSVD